MALTETWKRRTFALSACLFLLALSSRFALRSAFGAPNLFGRQLLQSAEAVEEEEDVEEIVCTDSFNQSFWGGFIYSLVILYICTAYFIICEEYLVHSLKAVCAKLHLPEDVAGATFLAAGSSAPELFSNLMDTFIFKNNIGMGTIVGSTVFNICIGLGVAALVCPPIHKIHWQAFLRDSFYYLFSIALVLGFLGDGKMAWYESMLLVLLYVAYCFHLKHNAAVMKWALGRIPKKYVEQQLEKASPSQEMDEFDPATSESSVSSLEKDEEKIPSKGPLNIVIHEDENKEVSNTEETYKPVYPDSDRHARIEDGEMSDLKTRPQERSCLGKTWHYIKAPLEFLFEYTIPSCETPENEHNWWKTMAMSIVYFSVLSYVMVLNGSLLGCVLNIPPVIMGSSFLAIGTSLPDVLGGISAARHGMVGMAISNSLGSNIFDICLAMGLPGFIYSLTEGAPVVLDSGELVGIVVTMLLSLLVLFAVLYICKWKLTTLSGYLLCFVYVVYFVWIFAVDENYD